MENNGDKNNADKNNSDNNNGSDSSVQPTVEEIEFFRSIMINFLNNNKKNLVEIYLKHNSEVGEGVLYLVLGMNKIDVKYVPVNVIEDEQLKNILLKRKEENGNNTNIIYMMMVTPCEASIIDVDIRDFM